MLGYGCRITTPVLLLKDYICPLLIF